MRMFSMLLRSTLHWAILPNRSDRVSRVVAVNRGSELSLLDESSEPDDGDRGRRTGLGSPSILTRARSCFSTTFSLCFLLVAATGVDAAASGGAGLGARTFAGRGSSGTTLCFGTRTFTGGALSISGVCGRRIRSGCGGGGIGRDGRSRGSLSTR
uniref:(northern house mosquito) hypothetical protein n=1 Tax=Culex pipiens TaxID=7175 RepID=A0A8D8JK85_CULPI